MGGCCASKPALLPFECGAGGRVVSTGHDDAAEGPPCLRRLLGLLGSPTSPSSMALLGAMLPMAASAFGSCIRTSPVALRREADRDTAAPALACDTAPRHKATADSLRDVGAAAAGGSTLPTAATSSTPLDRSTVGSVPTAGPPTKEGPAPTHVAVRRLSSERAAGGSTLPTATPLGSPRSSSLGRLVLEPVQAAGPPPAGEGQTPALTTALGSAPEWAARGSTLSTATPGCTPAFS